MSITKSTFGIISINFLHAKSCCHIIIFRPFNAALRVNPIDVLVRVRADIMVESIDHHRNFSVRVTEASNTVCGSFSLSWSSSQKSSFNNHA